MFLLPELKCEIFQFYKVSLDKVGVTISMQWEVHIYYLSYIIKLSSYFNHYNGWVYIMNIYAYFIHTYVYMFSNLFMKIFYFHVSCIISYVFVILQIFLANICKFKNINTEQTLTDSSTHLVIMQKFHIEISNFFRSIHAIT